ncbi:MULTISPECIES: alpha-amylase family glycosyl hydrolase [unclassified Nodularia (in: cyanobacteria)]|uniref:alpha-amylase family glycosyl hydrolase n=1 Tax=unclassified Nodularia (in: cyanobacteria) TaxID=2656917 RepID=UPI0018815BC5|nr:MULTISPECIES: alpha-amylase family glycosyl hydrolase [unclassified Nodularia (in: cyanobacteria)]MBE9200253.1 alpha-glucosidase C-terminal domain-containing protein [Nodularia sp. LEGE 06071]MCC2693396.1 alpha-glucosidase C-terminal domain-containing protein [Nodularia sp. LEGE 04288]
MYEQISHSLLNSILDDLKPEIRRQDLRHFYTRLGANFYAIHSLFSTLYGHRDDFELQMLRLVETMAKGYIDRSPELERLDIQREQDHNWFLSQKWVGMALYSNGFAENLADLENKIGYFQELGINMVHIMPILMCPNGQSDGGYAISDFRQIDDRVGSLEDIRKIAQEFRKRDILLILDIVLNHTSDEHEWAQKAKMGDRSFQDYYYIFENRETPDMFEQSMPEVFPETDPGNFTWDAEMEKWVMTVFHNYQWDLNYSNPKVFIEMLDIILFWANQGVDILRLDAVAFLWKKIGSSCQNERYAHLILQLMKDCCQVTAPGVLFIAEAIVAPVEVIKYFGEDAIAAKECEIAYNATLMALMWDGIATKNTKLIYQGIKSLPNKLERATWLNYVRCHDDIGLGFDDSDIYSAGYEPRAHRKFLVDYLTGQFDDSPSRGMVFMPNEATGDARICGSLASLVGLESALETADEDLIALAINRILLMHAIILSFGGIPLIYNGDAIAVLNDYSYIDDLSKSNDNRWVHRPKINWEKADLRKKQGTLEHTVFNATKKLIAIRKEISAFADFNNRELVHLENEHLLCFVRFNHQRPSEKVLVIANFDANPQDLSLESLRTMGFNIYSNFVDLYSGTKPEQCDSRITLQGYQFYWLTET